MPMRAKVHIIDDDAAIRDSLAALLGSVGIDTDVYASARAFLDASTGMQPGCILLDLRIPDIGGLELQALCREKARHLPVVFLTAYGDVDVSVRAMQQGATDFLTKPVDDERLLETVRRAIEIGRERQTAQHRRATLRARFDLLSARERQVLEGIVDGGSNKSIAVRLDISHKTVELHRANVMTKMHAGSLAELVRIYVRLNADMGCADA